MWQTLANATRETLIMLAPATIISIVLSLLIAIPLSSIETTNNVSKLFSKFLSLALAIIANLPFLAIALLLMPITNKLLTDNLSYMLASILPLTIAGTTVLSLRLSKILNNHRENLRSLTKILGASKFQQWRLIVLPEAKAEIISNCLDVSALLLSASLICGVFGAGGLGQLAVDSALGKYNPTLLISSLTIALALQTLISYTSQLINTQKR